MVGRGSKTAYQAQQRNWGTQDEKEQDIQGELTAWVFKNCSNYTLFHVLRQNLHVKHCNLQWRCHTPPPKKSGTDFLVMKAFLGEREGERGCSLNIALVFI